MLMRELKRLLSWSWDVEDGKRKAQDSSRGPDASSAQAFADIGKALIGSKGIQNAKAV
jgi:hypothetical protein